MKTFDSNDLFSAFLVFVGVFVLIFLVDLFYRHCKNRQPLLYDEHKSFRIHIKQLIARIIFMSKRESLSDAEVDKLQVFADTDEKPVDAVYFNTSSPNHQILMFATARRKNGVVNTMGFLKLPEFSKDLLVLPVFPSSTLYQNADEQNNLDSYVVAGVKITPVTPMKEYRIEYTGKMHCENNAEKEFTVEINAVWRSSLPAFNFSTQISRKAVSEAMAVQSWSREYFHVLKSHHQTHFEQYGSMDGVAKIDGKIYSIQTSGVRDRTIGALRDWNDFHRYVIHYIRLDNGNALTVGIISVPIMFNRLLIGFLTKGKDNINVPIDTCSIDLKKFDVHNPPESYEFDFVADNDSYRVHVKRHTKTKLFMGERSESCLIETWSDFKVNGVKGWGAVEYEHLNKIPSTEL